MRTCLAVLLLAVLVAGVAAQQAPEKMGIWVPLYVLPRGPNDTTDDYNRLITSVEADPCLKDSFHGTVLTGPYSKPPNVTDDWEREFYRERFGVISNTSQWTAFGYVTTRYGTRDLAEVLADIDVWLTVGGKLGYGDQVQGIWVDNVWNKFSTNNGTDGVVRDFRTYYKTIANYIKQKYNKIVAFNPGAQISDCAFLREAGVDFVNNFEDYYSVWLNRSSSKSTDCVCCNDVRCISSIHGWPSTTTKDDFMAAMNKMGNKGYKAMFLTDGVLPKHYLTLPSFWSQVVDAACTTTVQTANGVCTAITTNTTTSAASTTTTGGTTTTTTTTTGGTTTTTSGASTGGVTTAPAATIDGTTTTTKSGENEKESDKKSPSPSPEKEAEKSPSPSPETEKSPSPSPEGNSRRLLL